MDEASVFHELADVYDALIDWPKRLANEEPFYRHWFERFHVRSVVDVACGVGHHAAMFHQWGLRVEGADISPAMIDRARARFGQSEDLRWIVRGFDAPVQPVLPFDAAICVGNSLALAPNLETVRTTWRQMFHAVRPGGLVIVQVLNWTRLPDGPCVWQKCKRVATDHGEKIVVKGVHRCVARGYVDLIIIDANTNALQHTESVPLLEWESDEWRHIAQEAGAGQSWLLGDYHGHPYEQGESIDWILVAERSKLPNR